MKVQSPEIKISEEFISKINFSILKNTLKRQSNEMGKFKLQKMNNKTL